jgi:regulatory protein
VTDDHDDPGRPARMAEPVRVARFELLEGNGDRATRVAAFDGLDASEADRPLASVIPLDALVTRKGTGVSRASGREECETGVSPDRHPTRRRGRAPTGGDPSDDVVPSGDRQVPPAGRTDDGGFAGLPSDACESAGTADDIPPDGPLPRGRRKRARTGRLGPDAPDPELPLPEADPVAIAREICLRLLTDRARTRQELAQALARKGVPDEAAAEVLDRFAEVGLVDDAAFAGQWVRSRHTYRGLGRRAIAVELRRKGVADGVAKEALAEVDTESEDRRARELIDRKLRSMAVDTAEQRATAARRLVGMLARKGYGAGTAYRVVREALAEQGADADELGPGADLDG